MKQLTTIEAPVEGRVRPSKVGWAADVIKKRIKLGVYKSGTQLPSLRTLSAELNLNLPVMQRAVRQLERAGILESQHGVGIKVLETTDCRTTPLVFGFIQPYFSYFSMSLQQSIENALDTRFNLCITKSSRNSPERERQEIERLISTGIDGLLAWPVDADNNLEFFREISARLPVVFVDRTLDNIRAPSVVLDYAQAGRDILRSLYDQGLYRILVVCDPAEISSFKELKIGLNAEALSSDHVDTLTIVDYPVVRLIEAAYLNDYQPADDGYAFIAPMLSSGDYDAVFCPQSEYFGYTISDSERAATMANIHGVTMRSSCQLPHPRTYDQLNMEEWLVDSSKMVVTAVELIQDITLSKATKRRTVQIPIHRIATEQV